MKRVEQGIWCLCIALAACILWQSPVGDTLLAQPGGGIEVRKRDSNWITDFGGNAADGADGSDDTAFANLIAARIAVQQYDAFLPPGVWNVSTKVSLPAGFLLYGAGESSNIEMGSGMATAAIAGHARTVIRDLKITGPGYATAGSRGIEIIGTGGSDYRSRWKIQNVTVTQCADAFYLDYCGVGDIVSPFVTICGNGLHTDGTQVNVINLFGGEIHNCTNGALLETDPGSTCNFWGVTIEGNTAYGILLDNSTNGINQVTVKGCYFELNTTADICSQSDCLVTDLVLEDNYHLNFATAVLLNKCQLGRIQNNKFQVNSYVAQKAITLGASCRLVRVGANRYQPTGSLYYSPPTDDSGFGNTLDPRPDSFFALGDGTTDDTAALQAWLTANPSEAVFPAGTFIVSGALTLTQDQTVRGAGKARTVIKAASGYTGNIFKMGYRSRLKDLTVQGVATVAAGIVNNGPADDWIVDNVEIRSCDVGMKVDNQVRHAQVRNCLIRLNTVQGILLTSGSGTVEEFTVDGTRFTDNAVGVEVSGASRVVNLLNSRFDSNDTYGYYTSAAVNGGVIAGCTFSDNGTADVRLAASSRGYHVAGNRFDTTPTSLLLACLESTFESNVFNPGGMTPTTVTLGTVTDCEFGINRATTGTAPGPALVSGTRNTYLGSYYGNAAPGSGAWLTGDIVLDISPTSGSAGSFICTAAGSPGTWTNGPNVP